MSALYAEPPYSLSWKTDCNILTGNFIIDLTARLTEDNSHLTADEISGLARSDVLRFDRGATYHYSTSADKASNYLSYVCALTPLASGLFTDNLNSDWLTLFVMYGEMLVLADNLPDIAKALTGRLRPYVYNPDVPLNDKLKADSARRSFFSGHTTMAFAGAVFTSTIFSDYYPDSPWRPWLTGGLLTAATATGYLRYAAGMHYPSDILVGAMVGSVIGYLIPWTHREKNNTISMIMNSGRIDITCYF